MSSSTIPNIWKTSKIIPVPKKEKTTTMNDLRPIALTSVIMKCFERIVLNNLNKQISQLLEPFQFAYQPKRSVEDALLVFSNSIYRHLDKANSYCRILFVDFSSAFNTIQPHLLVKKLYNLNINKYVISWILEYLSNRPQFVYVNGKTSNKLITNTGAPQGCVISPVLFTLYTNDCQSNSAVCNPLLKFADDTSLLGLISDKNETLYRSEVTNFVQWCEANHLELNVNKTKEMIIDFRKKDNAISPLEINDYTIEQVSEYKYLGVTIDDKLHWSGHINNIKSKANKPLQFMRKLGPFKVDKTRITLFLNQLLRVFSLSVLLVGEGKFQRVIV